MKISDITEGEESIDEQIEILKERHFKEPDIDIIKEQIDPSKHLIFNKHKRKDKTVIEDVPGEEGKTREKLEPVARIAFAIQKYLVKIAAQFLFGNPVKIVSAQEKTEAQELLENALKKVLADNKEVSLNKKVARDVMSCLEVAEYWYVVEGEKKHNRYGFPTKFKVRSAIWSPLNGDKLYPLFDDTGDFIAFSREYTVKKRENNFTYFETYTSDEKVVWQKEDNGKWEEITRTPNLMGKIPVIYARQEETEWADAQWIIERLETLASNHADTNDYHSSPKIVVNGKIMSFAAKGETGAIIEMEQGGDAKYMSWDNAPESVRLEWNNLLEMLSTITQTPKSFFESLENKAGGQISGVALKMKFLSAHLKVEDKKEIFIEYMQRRYSIISTILGEANTGLKPAIDEIDFEPEIEPYMIDDEKALIENLSLAGGGKSFASRKTIVEALGWATDVDAEVESLKDEEIGGMEI